MLTTMPFIPLPIWQAEVEYEYGPDSSPRAGVPSGSLEELTIESSARFPGTSRKIWIHTPFGHSSSAESAVMFFNDGWWYVDPTAAVRGAAVLDNLAAENALPPMVSVSSTQGFCTSMTRRSNIAMSSTTRSPTTTRVSSSRR